METQNTSFGNESAPEPSPAEPAPEPAPEPPPAEPVPASEPVPAPDTSPPAEGTETEDESAEAAS